MGKKTITLKGDAARAFLQVKHDQKPATEDDRLRQFATAVHLAVAIDDMPKAVKLLKAFRAEPAIQPESCYVLYNLDKQLFFTEMRLSGPKWGDLKYAAHYCTVDQVLHVMRSGPPILGRMVIQTVRV